MNRARTHPQTWIDASVEKPAPMDVVDIYVLGVGRVTDCSWSRGRQQWIKSIPHGLVEYHLSPTHWRKPPPSPGHEGLKSMWNITAHFWADDEPDEPIELAFDQPSEADCVRLADIFGAHPQFMGAFVRDPQGAVKHEYAGAGSGAVPSSGG